MRERRQPKPSPTFSYRKRPSARQNVGDFGYFFLPLPFPTTFPVRPSPQSPEQTPTPVFTSDPQHHCTKFHGYSYPLSIMCLMARRRVYIASHYVEDGDC
jgi:hypothetical protein